MTLKQLARKVSDITSTPEKTARLVVEEAFDVITDALASGESVRIPYFGRFTTSTYQRRTILNILNNRCQNVYQVAEHPVPKLIPWSTLKYKVRYRITRRTGGANAKT
jgi:nucleoid DNA-binding protein